MIHCSRSSPVGVYLRARGGTLQQIYEKRKKDGLSPRTRRNRAPPTLRKFRTGSISAGDSQLWGLSPRMRRNPHDRRVALHVGGSISAHAEEPWTAPVTPRASRVYLRACGGTCFQIRPADQKPGLSPRMRRNRLAYRKAPNFSGSISAHAEEPKGSTQHEHGRRVYLRACGGTGLSLASRYSHSGLSPRMRRNHLLIVRSRHNRGSISAHAEEPEDGWAHAWGRRVYLRACGGTSDRTYIPRGGQGLSPRMRRNRAAQVALMLRQGSISAHAEEPRAPDAGGDRAGVYLRACGGTPWSICQVPAPTGLSPRMRRNLVGQVKSQDPDGSISAHAEEPPGPSKRRINSRVYLRACGGTTRAVETSHKQ